MVLYGCASQALSIYYSEFAAYAGGPHLGVTQPCAKTYANDIDVHCESEAAVAVITPL